jgi:trk system potassium uptake protein TrkH
MGVLFQWYLQRRARYKAARKTLTLARILVLGVVSVILCGAVLLILPVSARDGVEISFPDALFTSASAACVTGLTVVDTASTWSVFGQIVILCLMQIGGLGFMAITSVFFFIMHKKIGLSQRLLMAQSLNLHDIKDVVGLIRHVLAGTILFEGFGAFVMWFRFIPQFGFWNGLGMGFFHSVSAFCNAGFDLMGGGAPFSSLTAYSGDALITVVTSLLVFIGGLGFFVWEDIWRKRNFKKLHLHSKLVLTISFSLIILGWIFFYLTERKNPGTMGGMPFRDAVIASMVQSVMPRSGGFCVVDQEALTGISKMATITLMLIGGSAGSTAGGIKNVTVGILFLSAINTLRGRHKLSVFGRSIPERQVISALSIFIIVSCACLAGTVAISFIQPDLPFFSVVFETVSAVSTCGLSHGITATLVPASLAVIILLMLFGRVGIVTLGMAVFINRNNTEKTKRPDTWVMM